VGVSATAAYRHFASKEDLLASVAAEGFRELGLAMETGRRGVNPLSRAGLAYVEFALQNRGLFRLMFGPVLAERAKYPGLKAATDAVGELLIRNVADLDQRALDFNAAAMAAWGLVHGLSHLFADGFVSSAQAMGLAEEILAKTRLPRPPPESTH
jgi:AcrR family transcriptional regulator